MQNFQVVYPNEPQRNRTFKVRGICKCDVLNPCWDDRPSDVIGEHWGGGPACDPCAKAALAKAKDTAQAGGGR